MTDAPSSTKWHMSKSGRVHDLGAAMKKLLFFVSVIMPACLTREIFFALVHQPQFIAMKLGRHIEVFVT
jgi:hypothetical protein